MKVSWLARNQCQIAFYHLNVLSRILYFQYNRSLDENLYKRSPSFDYQETEME